MCIQDSVKPPALLVLRNLFRDTYIPMNTLTIQCGSNPQSVRDYLRAKGIKRDPKYPKPLLYGCLRSVRLPVIDWMKT